MYVHKLNFNTHTHTHTHWTQGPQVGVDCASLQFGLVPLGTSSQLTLTLTSHTNTSLSLLIRQAVNHTHTNTEQNITVSTLQCTYTPCAYIRIGRILYTLLIHIQPCCMNDVHTTCTCCVPTALRAHQKLFLFIRTLHHNDSIHNGLRMRA